MQMVVFKMYEVIHIGILHYFFKLLSWNFYHLHILLYITSMLYIFSKISGVFFGQNSVSLLRPLCIMYKDRCTTIVVFVSIEYLLFQRWRKNECILVPSAQKSLVRYNHQAANTVEKSMKIDKNLGFRV